MTDIVSIIQSASFGGVDRQASLTSIRCKKMMFWILRVKSGNPKLNDTDVTGLI